MENNDILYSLLQLSQFEHKDFSELEVAKALGQNVSQAKKIINDLKDYLKITPKARTKCICGAEIKIAGDLSFVICPNCKQRIDINKLSSMNIGLNYSRLEQHFQKEIVDFLKNEGWELKDQEEEKFTLLKDDYYICFSFGLFKANLNDYFVQRGWLNKTDIDAYIIIRPVFEADLIAYMQKDLKCLCINMMQVLKANVYAEFENYLFSRIKLFKENQTVEKQSGLVYEDFGDLSEVKSHLNKIVKNIEDFAHQKGEVSASAQGREYQKYIVSLFNLSLFRTKLLGGKNEPDAFIYLFPTIGKIWCPVEIKSSKEEIFKVKDESLQLRKYCEAFKSSYIIQHADIKYYILIANDFEEGDSYSKNILDTLERDFNIKFRLFPLKSVLRMANLFIKDPPIYIPVLNILDFLQTHNYIDIATVDALHAELKALDAVDDPIFKYINKTVEKYGVS